MRHGRRMARKKWYLTEWREHRGLTQDQLAEKATALTDKWEYPVRLTGGDVSKLERGKRRFNQSHLDAFSQILRCEPPDLFYTPEEADEVKRIVQAIVKRGRSSDLRLLRAMAGEDDDANTA